jgi:hypothetical protein
MIVQEPTGAKELRNNTYNMPATSNSQTDSSLPGFQILELALQLILDTLGKMQQWHSLFSFTTNNNVPLNASIINKQLL